MDINLAVVTNFFRGFTKPHPTREWALILGAGALLFIAGAAIAAQLFWGTQTGSIVAASADVPRAPIPVSRDSIKKVIEAFQIRATNYQAKVFPAVTLSDPRPITPRK